MARNCDFVPIHLDFPRGNEIAGTIFEGQTTLKLGTHCRGDREYDNYTLKEYLTYRLFNLVTPLSFRARLARATYVDAKTKKTVSNRYSIFIEHENEVARRFGGRIVELPRITFNDLDAPTLNRMMLFEYMIGNTDFSIWALHNVRIVQDKNRKLFPVPYDFDLSGLVHAPYAAPDPRIGLRSEGKAGLTSGFFCASAGAPNWPLASFTVDAPQARRSGAFAEASLRASPMPARRERNASRAELLKVHSRQNWYQTGTGLAQKTKKSAGANLLTLVYLGSPTWARTRDLRINSPALYRLSYRGTAANYSEVRRPGFKRAQSKTGVSTPSTLCSFGLVVVYCRWMRLSGKMYGAAANAASAASWKPDRISFFLPG